MKNTSNKIILIIAAVGAVACGIVRWFQISGLIDYSTGFFLKGAEFGGAVVYIMLAVFAVILVTLAFIGKRKEEPAFFLASDGMGSNATRVLGISQLAAAVIAGLRLTRGLSTLETAETLVFAAALLVSGYILLQRIVPPMVTGYLQYIGAVYFVLRTGAYFNSDLIIASHSEHLLVLFAFILSAAHFASGARFYSRTETVKSRLREIITALLTFLVTGTHTIADLIAVIQGGGAAEYAVIEPDVAAAAAVSGAYLAVVYFTEKKKDIVPIVEE